MKSLIKPLIKPLLILGLIVFTISSCDKENTTSSDKENGETTKIIYGDGVTDINGYTYKSVIIGSQEWISENIRVDKFRNGDQIATTDPSTLNIDEEIDPIYQWVFESDIDYLENYGRLYTWYAATDLRGLCPTGWRVPSDDDWVTLILFLDNDMDLYAVPFLSPIAGGKLKSTRTQPDPHPRWNNPNINATDLVGFSALPGAHRCGYHGDFQFSGYSATWWSSHDYVTGFAVESNNGNANRFYGLERDGRSVRCIKN